MKSESKDANSKKRRRVFTLEEKFDIINKHKSGKTNAAIARLFGINESTVRSILKKTDDYEGKCGGTSTSSGIQTSTNKTVEIVRKDSQLQLKQLKSINVLALDEIESKSKHASSIKSRRVFTLEERFDIIKKHESGMTNAAISHLYEMNESTVRTILKQINDRKEDMVASTSSTIHTTGNRGEVIGNKKREPKLKQRKSVMALTLDKITSGSREENIRKKRRVFTLEEKLSIIKKYESGLGTTAIGRLCGISESTVRSILKKADEYKEKCRVAASGMQISRNRSVTMIEMERLLSMWTENCYQKQIPLSIMAIKMKALSIFGELKENVIEKDIQIETPKTFTASTGWFENYKIRSQLHVPNIFEGNPAQVCTPFVEEITKIGKEDGSNENHSVAVCDLIESHTECLHEHDIKTEPQQEYEDREESETDNILTTPVKELTLKELDLMFLTMETLKRQIIDADPNIERCTKVQHNLENSIHFYRRLYEDMRNVRDEKLDAPVVSVLQ